MITLRKYLYGESGAASGDAESARAFCDSLAQLAMALLNGLEEHVFGEPHSAFQAFGGEARTLRERLVGDVSPDDIRAMATDALSLLKEFRQARQQVQETEASEVQKMVAMLNKTITMLAGGSERSLARLQQVESDLMHASAMSDIVALNGRLTTCMLYVRAERKKEQRETASNITEIERDVQHAQDGFALARTGISTRTEAEKSVAEAVTNGESAMAIIVLDRLPSIKARFNAIVAERFLSSFGQDLSERLPSPNRLFRWNDQSLLVELSDTKALDARTAEVRERLKQMPRERQLDVGQRHAVFSNSHRWTLMRPAESQTLPAAILRIEQFVQG
jgi:GGDEF domain-containing protein